MSALILTGDIVFNRYGLAVINLADKLMSIFDEYLYL